MARRRSKLRSKHIRFAHSTRYEKNESFFEGKTAEQLIEGARIEAKRMGYRIVKRKLIKPTTTLFTTIYLGKDFDYYHPVSQAAIWWHELVHGRQWRDGRNLFPLRYINRRWQWVFETQGYRQQVRVIRALAGDNKAIEFARRVPSIMQKKPYTMRRLDSKQIRYETLKAFRIGLPELEIY